MKARIHVDYLSHDWEATDVICAHTQIHKQIRSINVKLNENPENKSIRVEYQRLNRYKNALWRQMSRTCTSRLGKHNHLVHPSSVNWQKESDITWLYGPLYTNESDDEEITMTTSTSTTTTKCHNNSTSLHHNHTRQHDLKPVLKSSIYVRRRRQGLIGATETVFGEYDDGEQRIPSFSSIASTSSSTSSILPPSTPINSTSVRFSPESTKIQYFIPESPVQEFLGDKNNYSSFTSSYYDINSSETVKVDSWNPYWSYESDDEDNIYSYEDDDDQEDDDLWELMVGVTYRIKDWFIPPRRKPATRNSSNNSATANTSTISSNYINTSGGLLDLVFTLISVAKSVASLMATWVVYQGLVRMLWVVRRPAIRHQQPQQQYFQLKQYNNDTKKNINNKKFISSPSSSSLSSSSSYTKNNISSKSL
ncbi:hypothetical protein INT45_002082 [Circinella minor]|uniref:Uncharacterized protein n=1 Tax=Circinella minor TaxID=1195481 RepID=A0A8H7VUR9_9FUNG|nr:hypothetical protein INT45_002082 [Circinella minor]